MEDFRFLILCNSFNKKKKLHKSLLKNILKEIKKPNEIQLTLTIIQDYGSRRKGLIQIK